MHKLMRLAAVVAALALLLTGCATSRPQPPASSPTAQIFPRAIGTVAKAPENVTFAVAGDSITAWLNYSYPNWNGYNDPHSWARYAVSAHTIMLGGYARSGAGVVHVLADIVPTGADVLVIHLGTNDYNMTPDVMMPYLNQIVAKEASPHVVVVAIPPLITRPSFVNPDNAALKAWAKAWGYTFVDPYMGLVTLDGSTWLPGFSADGIHPLPSTAALTGPVIASAIHAAMGW